MFAVVLGACGAAQPAPERPVLSRSAIGVAQVPTVSAIPIPDTANRVEMPWIWRVLRSEVYRRLPRVRSRSRNLAVVSPVIVEGPNDSVPGVGFEGGF